MMPPIPRATHYIGQEATLAVLRRRFEEIRATPVCRMVYVEANGGIGKTFLLEKLPDILGRVYEPRLAQIIDLSGAAFRSGSAIEAQIIAGLEVTDPTIAWYGFAPSLVTDAFTAYRWSRQEYERERGRVPESQRRALVTELRERFITALNSLSMQHPIVLRFDTAETLVGASPAAELAFLQPEFPSAAGFVAEWMTEILPRLRHVLVVICGRPVGARESLYTVCARITDLDAEQCELAPLTQDDARQYLVYAFGESPTTADSVPRIAALMDEAYRMSDGFPLLLACFVEMYRRSDGLPPPPIALKNRAAFTEYLVSVVLNPLGPHTPFERQVLIYALYVLCYARRGLSLTELRQCMEQCHYPKPHAEFTDTEQSLYDRIMADLPFVALVKIWPGTGQLYIHDEMHRMIDGSRLPDVLGMRDEVLHFLIRLARKQQDDANRLPSSTETGIKRLQATINRIYYELVRRPEDGYYQYLLAIPRLLATREPEQLVILRDELWRWLNVEALDASDTVRGQQIRYPNRERFAASAQSTLADVALTDAVWLVKYYRIANVDHAVERALTIAQRIREYFREALQQNDFARTDLDLAEASMMLRSTDTRQADRLFADVTAFLLNGPVQHPFLREHGEYFLGDVFTLWGYLHRTRREYDQAAADYLQALKHLTTYQKQLADRESHMGGFAIDDARAQMRANLAFLDVQQGNFDRAQSLARQLRATPDYDRLSPYYQALAWNINAIVEVTLGRREQAHEYVMRAWKLATEVRDDRQLGQISRQYGVTLHEITKQTRQIDLQAEQYFVDAKKFLANDTPGLIETLDEHSKCERTQALIYREHDNIAASDACLVRAEHYIDEALLKTGTADLPVLQAQLYQGKAFIYRIRDQLETAETILAQATNILRAARMPRYAHIIAGSVVFEHSQLVVRRITLLASDSQHAATIERVHEFARRAASYYIDALAHCFIFSDENRTRGIFERLIRVDLDAMPDEGILEIHRWLAAGAHPVTDSGADMIVSQPDHHRWEAARRRSGAFLDRVCTAIIETRALFL